MPKAANHRRRIVFALLAMLGFAFAPTLARAAELVMFERDGCPYCARWDRDVGPVYPLTDLGKRVPLRRINLDRQKADVTLAAPVRFTPTFVLMDEGREIGRITGYMDDAMFWGVFSKLAEKLAPPSPAQER